MTGRPVEYKEEYPEMVNQYLQECKDSQYTLIKSTGTHSQTFENKVKVMLPSIEGFARYIKVHKETLYEWAKKFPMLSDALDKIRDEQKERLINSGLSGDYNSTIAKLLLSANHGMREGTDVTSNGEQINTSLSVEQKQKLDSLLE